MHIMTILGTRPEIIRLSRIIEKLDDVAEKHTLVHTGQNFTHTLSDVFFEELKIRKPDYFLKVSSFLLGEQIGTMFTSLEHILSKEKPDRVLLLGDTNSALSAILMERHGIPVYHMEAGNRCYDLRVPEEKNRRIIDAISTYNLPYTKKSRENLLKENIPVNRIFLTGNPIYEVINHYTKQIDQSNILEKLVLEDKNYFLVTVHRSENVDSADVLKDIFTGLNKIAKIFDKRIICSIHPRTKSKLEGISDFRIEPLVEFHEPFGLFDFIKLQKHAFCVLTDSGTVQEESCILRIPAVTIRNTTERPETVECGSNIIAGTVADSIVHSVQIMLKQSTDWEIPDGYGDTNVSQKVVNYLMGVKGLV